MSAFISPRRLTIFRPTALGLLFVVYLAGSVLTPWTGWAVARFGRRRFVDPHPAVWAVGIALTLLPSLPAIIAGLAICAGLRADLPGGLDRLCHRDGQGRALIGGRTLRDELLSRRQRRRRGSAALPGRYGKWPLCVAMVLVMLAVMISDRHVPVGAARAAWPAGHCRWKPPSPRSDASAAGSRATAREGSTAA